MALAELQSMFNDDELLRFQKEYYRIMIYATLKINISNTLWRLEFLKRDLEPILDVLSTMREDELEDFVRSKENRREDVESNVRALKRREDAAKEEERQG